MSYRGTFVAEYLYCDKCQSAFVEAMEWAVKYNGQGIVAGFFKDPSHTEGMWIFLNALSEIPLCEGHHIDVAVFWEGNPTESRIVRVGNMSCEEISPPGHPEEMQGRKIIFSKCDKGHGHLRGENWVEHQCQVCRAEAAEALLLLKL